MKMNYSKNTSQGPSSAIGIMKFKETNAGPALSPEMVIGFSVAVAILILVARYLFRF